jgi:hypothetical protein
MNTVKQIVVYKCFNFFIIQDISVNLTQIILLIVVPYMYSFDTGCMNADVPFF